jgi:hypothetical protein
MSIPNKKMKTRDDLYLQLIQGLANCLITKGFCGVPVTEEELMELAESYGWQRENTTGGKVHEVVAIVREWVKKGIVEVREERGKVTSNRTTFVLRDPNSLNADNADNADNVDNADNTERKKESPRSD